MMPPCWFLVFGALDHHALLERIRAQDLAVLALVLAGDDPDLVALVDRE
jgi:hypothetical protein